MCTESLRITVLQTNINCHGQDKNLSTAESLIQTHAAESDLIILPEMFNTGFTNNTTCAEECSGKTVTTLKRWAKQYEVALVSSFLCKENNLFYNRAFLISPQGEEHYRDKRHLFSIGGENKLSPGSDNTIIQYNGWNIRLLVCYDLRFPVWSRNIKNEYDLLIYTANWPEVRAKVWSALLIARAIENIAYVCGVNRVGTDSKNLNYAGESMVINPIGETLYKASNQTCAQTITLKKATLNKLREHFPVHMDADHFTIKT